LSERLARRRKIFNWIATVGLIVFGIFLLFIVISLHACEQLTLQR
jgi:hypothetical protein